MDDGEPENRPTENTHQDEPVSNKLDRVLDKLEKIDLWRDETDRRFESSDPNLSQETEPPLGFEDEEREFENFQRGKSMDRGVCFGNPTTAIRDEPYDGRGRREDRFRNGSGWDQTGLRQPRQQIGGYAWQFDRPISRWDPPHRYNASAQGDKQQQVTMKPPKFDGSDATNWVSRV